ncbi:MAG: MFS transporter [Roseococcus sp.]
MTSPGWIAALGVTLLMQAVASFLGQSLPVLAPLITENAGMSPESIGHLSAVVAGGTVLFLLLGSPFLARWGPVRTLQFGAVLSAVAMLVAGFGTPAALLLASLLIGIGYGPSPPAGSRILAATAPPGHRSLIFSVKQAGAPLGGACAGLITAPIAAALGWSSALLATVGISILAALVIQPFKRGLDRERDTSQRLDWNTVLRREAWLAPMLALRQHPMLPPLTLLAMSFATLQGCLFTFTVTWLTVQQGLSLVEAGVAFACLQASGVVARIVLGWLADRTGRPMRNLLVQAMLASLCALAFGAMPQGLPHGVINLLAAAAGFLAVSWNGIYLAEVARLVPPGQIALATAGSTLFTFMAYLAAPALFALIVSWSGGWSLPFTLAAGQLGVVALLVALALRRAARLTAGR